MPHDEESVATTQKIQMGDTILVDYKRHRNVGNHKRLFSLLNMIVQNTDKYKTVDNLLAVCKLKAGLFETVVSHDGNVVYIPKSINFASLGEDEFKTFFSSVIDTCLEFCDEDMVNNIVSYA